MLALSVSLRERSYSDSDSDEIDEEEYGDVDLLIKEPRRLDECFSVFAWPMPPLSDID